jgi:hypothetical protein
MCRNRGSIFEPRHFPEFIEGWVIAQEFKPLFRHECHLIAKRGRLPVLIPEQAAHRFRDDAAHPFRLIVARHSD